MSIVGQDRIVSCPKCGAPMIYHAEKEKNSRGETRITKYFRCPVCGTKIIDEKLLIKPVNGSLKILDLTGEGPTIIPGVRRVRKTRRPRPPLRRQ